MPAARTSPASEETVSTVVPAGPAAPDGTDLGDATDLADVTDATAATDATDATAATDATDGGAPEATTGDHPSGWPTGRLLSTAARLVEQRWNEALARFDLTHAGFGVVAHLMAGPLSQHQVAGLTKVEDQTISRTLDKLERQGHVRREQDAADRRRRVVTVTPEGRQAFAAIAASGMDLEMVDDRVAEHCDLDDFRAALVALLEPGAGTP